MERERLVHIEQPQSKKGEGKAQIAEKFDGEKKQKMQRKTKGNGGNEDRET